MEIYLIPLQPGFINRLVIYLYGIYFPALNLATIVVEFQATGALIELDDSNFSGLQF